MNASSWRKAADLVAQGTQANQQVQAAATAESNQLESLPLSALSADDSSPPQVTYGTEQPLTASTPRATLTSIPETQTTDTYHQIIPGMSEHLYPTLVADDSLSTPIADNCSTLQNQITSEIDKHLQKAAERHAQSLFLVGYRPHFMVILLSIVVAFAFTLVVAVVVQITLGNVVRVYPGTVQGLTFYLSKIYI